MEEYVRQARTALNEGIGNLTQAIQALEKTLDVEWQSTNADLFREQVYELLTALRTALSECMFSLTVRAQTLPLPQLEVVR